MSSHYLNQSIRQENIDIKCYNTKVFGSPTMKSVLVSQPTNAVTGVTVNGSAIEISTQNFTTGVGGTTSFVLTNSSITANSMVIVQWKSYTGTLFTNGLPEIKATGMSAGSCNINVYNYHPTNILSGGFVIQAFIINFD
jgi:hypothetical protein